MNENDGSITFSVWLDADEAEHELSNLKKKILDLEKDLAAKKEIRSGLEENLQRAAAAAKDAERYLYELRDEQERINALTSADPGYMTKKQDLARINAEIKEQEAAVKRLYREYDAAAAAVAKNDSAIQSTTAQLNTEQAAYGEVQKQALAAGDAGVQSAQRTASATDQLNERFKKFTSRIGNIAKTVLVFSLLTRALRALRDYLGGALKTNEEFQAALARLKGALATAFQPILTAAVPYLTALINVLARAMTMVARFTSMLFGSTVESSADAAEALYDEADALNAVGGGAGKASKSLAGFDEINQLSGGGGGGGKAAGKPDFGLGDELDRYLSETEAKVALALLLGGVALTVIGASMANLGMVIAGLGLLGTAVSVLSAGNAGDWVAMLGLEKAYKWIDAGLLIGGMALVVGGIVTGNIPLVLAGLGLLGTDIALGEGTGQGLGAGLAAWLKQIHDGADQLKKDFQELSENPSSFGDQLKEGFDGWGVWWQDNAVPWFSRAKADVLGWFSGIGSGAKTWALQISAGATTLSDDAKSIWSGFSAWWAGHATPWLAGVGDGFRMWFGQIGDGARTLGADFKKIWSGVSSWWRASVSPIFTAQWWSDKFSSIKDGMKTALNGVIQAVETALNWIIGQFNSLSFDVGTPWGDKHIGFSIPTVSIPRLAAGAVIPPNREFLAILGDQKSGTNIEAPLDTIVAAFRQVMREGGGGSRTLVLQVDRQELGRIVFDAYNAENSRVGVRLGGAP